jgi:chorismate mutase/prephenate dehydratase
MDGHKREVDKLRQTMAALDDELTALLEKRARAARSVGALLQGEAPVLPLRDRAFVETLIARSKGDLAPDALRAIFREVHAACTGLETAAHVSVIGPEGGAGHAAAREQFGLSADCVVMASAEEALDAVVRERADFAMLPLETSSDGLVHSTVSALSEHDLRICLVREVVPTLHLVNRTGNLEEVQKLYATAADRALVARSIAELRSVAVVDVESPLLACQLAAEDPTGAALATESTAALQRLEVARRSMLDEPHVRVRYAVVGPRPSQRTGDDRTAIAFSVTDAPEALLAVLGQFAEHNVNLTRIQSRPVLADAWAYVFFVEVIGHATDRQVVSAFDGVKRLTKPFRVLGAYPALG